MNRKWIAASFAAVFSAFVGATASFAGQGAPTAPYALKAPMAAGAKKMPMRDAKGRFMKAPPKKMHMMPMRGANGRFVKAPMMSSAHKMPMRDSKGRFMKATPK